MLRYEGEDEFLGKNICAETAHKIATCVIDPVTHASYTDTIKKRKDEGTKVFYKKNTGLKKGISK